MTGQPAIDPQPTLAPLRERTRAQAPLWFVLLGGPAAWGLHLGLSYLIVPEVCATGQVLWLHLISVVALVIGVLALATAATLWKRARRAVPPVRPDDRTLFIALAGLFLSGLFVGVTLFEGLQVFLMDPCR